MNQEPVAARASANDARSQEQPVPIFIRLSYPKTKEILAIHLFSITPSRNKEKKSKSFLFSPDYLQFEDKGMFYQFLLNIHITEFCCFSRLPQTSQRKFSSVFSRSFQANIFIRVFLTLFDYLPSEVKECNIIFLGASEKPNQSSSLLFSFISLPVILSNGDYGQADSRATHKM
jgi:hypothetical protein